MGPHGHLNQMTGRDRDTSRDASHRLARLQKRYWYFLIFSTDFNALRFLNKIQRVMAR